MRSQALEKALQLRTRDDAQHIYEAPRKLIDDAPIADPQAIERTTGRLQALDSFAGRQRIALQLTEGFENPALLRRIEALELALCPSRQTDLPARTAPAA